MIIFAVKYINIKLKGLKALIYNSFKGVATWGKSPCTKYKLARSFHWKPITGKYYLFRQVHNLN